MTTQAPLVQAAALDIAGLTRRRIRDPHAIAEGWATRRRGAVPADGRLLVVAADHPARAALSVRGDADAMANRGDLLRRLATALSRPGVDGVLGTPDILEDLLLLGLLDDLIVIGSMNRGGLPGAAFEFDDRFTAYDVPAIAANRLDGGKMLTRICLDDPLTAATLEASGHAVSALAAHRLMAIVEPFVSVRRPGERAVNRLDADSVITSAAVAAGLGSTSAYTWLKLPVVPEMDRVLAATTLPALLLGGEPKDDPDKTYSEWAAALACPTAAGLVVGRTLLYPEDGDVAGAVDVAVDLVHGGAR